MSQLSNFLTTLHKSEEEQRQRDADDAKRFPNVMGTNAVETPTGAMDVTKLGSDPASAISYVLQQGDMDVANMDEPQLQALQRNLYNTVEQLGKMSTDIPEPKGFRAKRYRRMLRVMNPGWEQKAKREMLLQRGQFMVQATHALATIRGQLGESGDPLQNEMRSEFVKQWGDRLASEWSEENIDAAISEYQRRTGKTLTEDEDAAWRASAKGAAPPNPEKALRERAQYLDDVAELKKHNFSNEYMAEMFGPDLAAEYERMPKPAAPKADGAIKPMTAPQIFTATSSLMGSMIRMAERNSEPELETFPYKDAEGEMQTKTDLVRRAPQPHEYYWALAMDEIMRAHPETAKAMAYEFKDPVAAPPEEDETGTLGDVKAILSRIAD